MPEAVPPPPEPVPPRILPPDTTLKRKILGATLSAIITPAVIEQAQAAIDALRGDLKQLKTDLLGLTKTLGLLTKTEAVEGIDSIKQATEQMEAKLRKAAGIGNSKDA